MKPQSLDKGTVFVALAAIIWVAASSTCAGQPPPPVSAPNHSETTHAQRQCPGGSKSSPNDGVSGPLDASIAGNVYRNRFFGFSLSVPHGWMVVPNLTSRAGVSQNRKQVANPGGEQQPSTRTVQEGPIQLLLLVENLPGKPPAQWRRLVVMANKLKDPNVSIDDHLKYGAQLLREKNSPAQMVGEPQRVTVAGRTFWKQPMTQIENGQTHHLAMFATRSKGFSVQFILGGVDGNDPDRLEPVLESLHFF